MDSEIKNEISKLDKNVRIILIIGAIAIIILPIITTQFSWLFDFSNTGEIGDTLSGTTAPVIGIVSALLIYFSFRAQIRANEIIQIQFNQQKQDQKEDKEFEFQMERYKHLKELIDEFKIKKREPFENFGDKLSEEDIYEGQTGILLFFLSVQTHIRMKKSIDPSSKAFSQMLSIISFFRLIINNIKPIQDDENSKFVFNLIENQFYIKIFDQNKKRINETVNSNESTHAFIFETFKKIQEIDIELSKLKLIWTN